MAGADCLVEPVLYRTCAWQEKIHSPSNALHIKHGELQPCVPPWKAIECSAKDLILKSYLKHASIMKYDAQIAVSLMLMVCTRNVNPLMVTNAYSPLAKNK